MSQDAKILVVVFPILIILPYGIYAFVMGHRLRKRRAAIVFMLIYTLCIIVSYAAYLLGISSRPSDGELVLFITAFNAFGFMGLADFNILSNSTMAEATEQSSSKRQEGILFSAFSFAQ